jgi:hypothetical protein
MSTLLPPFVFRFEKLLWYRITTLLASPIGSQLPFLESDWFIPYSFYKGFQPITKIFKHFVCIIEPTYLQVQFLTHASSVSVLNNFFLYFSHKDFRRQSCIKRDSCYCYGNISLHFDASQSCKGEAEWTVKSLNNVWDGKEILKRMCGVSSSGHVRLNKRMQDAYVHRLL